MQLTDEDVLDVAQRLFRARKSGVARTAAVPAMGVLTESDGYRVQAALLELHLEAGDSLAGYKIGLASPGAQAAYGASSPAWGFLLQSSVLDRPDDTRLPPARARKIEAEFAFVLDEDLPAGNISGQQVIDATRQVLLAAEIVDTRWVGGAGDLGSLIADDVSNEAVVLGPEVLKTLAASAEIDARVEAGGCVEMGSSSAVAGSPANAVAWLASALAHHGRRLTAGQLIMSGSFNTPLAVDPSDDVLVDFGDLGRLRMAGV